MYKLTLKDRYNYLQKDGTVKEVYTFTFFLPLAEDPAYNVKTRYVDELFRRRVKEAIPDIDDKPLMVSFGFVGTDIIINKATVKIVI